MKRSNFHTENLTILVATVKNLVATVQNFSRHCTKFRLNGTKILSPLYKM